MNALAANRYPRGMNGPPAIELAQVSRTYGRGEVAIAALRDVSLRVGRGELVVVKGPSGSGKTTLLNLLGGLDRPSAGLVRVAGHDLGTMSDAALSRFRNRHVGFVFQAFHLEAHQTAAENVALPLIFTGLGRAERHRRAVAVLGRVGLSAKAEARADTPAPRFGSQARAARARGSWQVTSGTSIRICRLAPPHHPRSRGMILASARRSPCPASTARPVTPDPNWTP